MYVAKLVVIFYLGDFHVFYCIGGEHGTMVKPYSIMQVAWVRFPVLAWKNGIWPPLPDRIDFQIGQKQRFLVPLQYGQVKDPLKFVNN